jgi:two-component system CheB/CheR fusion protein
MVNMPLQNVTGNKFRNFIAESSKIYFDELFKEAHEGYIKEEIFIEVNGGRPLSVLMSINIFWLDNNFVLSIILTDLTIRNKNQENFGLLASIVESSDDAIISKSLDGIIKSWNKGAEKMFGYSSLDAIGKSIRMLIPEVLIEQESEIVKRIGNNEIVYYETLRTKKNGEQFYVSITVSPLKNAQGKIIGASKIARDISERKKSEQELILTNQELLFQINEKEKGAAELNIATTDVRELEELIIHKESILAILSHDLRSPLTAIIGTADYLHTNFDKIDRKVAKEMLNLLHKSSKEELNMLDYLVEWARIKYASDAFCPVKIELVQYVKKVFQTLNELASRDKVSLHYEIEENESVFADEKMLLSILQNIISNAIKHSKPEGKITVIGKKKEDKIIVEIKDNGIGMSKEIREKLFTPQMGTLAKERKISKGAGIGLLLVKGFLEKNGGEIWVESTEDKGSSFYFTLPAGNHANKET